MYRTVEIMSNLVKIRSPKWVDLTSVKSFYGEKSLSEARDFAKSFFTPSNNFVRVFIVDHYSNGRRAIKEVKG